MCRRIAFVLALMSGASLGSGQLMKKLSYSSDYFGNSFGASRDVFVQSDALGLAVLPGGTFYVNSIWDEGSREVGIYRDGKVIGKLRDTHGWGRLGGGAICSDGSHYVFMALRQSYVKAALGKRGFPQKPGENWYAIRRFDLKGNPTPFVKPGTSEYQDEFGVDGSMQTVSKDEPGAATGAFVQGLAAANGKLYASDYSARKIRVYDVQSFREQPAREFSIESGRIPFQIAAASHGNSLWVIERATPYGAATIAEYAPSGKPTGKRITDIANPSAVAVAPDGKLIVADDGPLQVVSIYDVSSGSPKRTATVGEPHGMFGTNPGQAGPYRFNGITGVGMDSTGTLIIACNEAGVDLRPMRDLRIKAEPGKLGEHHAFIRSFRHNAATGKYEFVNELHSFLFVDVGEVYGNNLFTPQDCFSLPAGLNFRSATWVSTHLNRFAYPDDPRLHINFSTPWIRNVQGKQLLYLTGMFPTQGLAVYRFDGRIAVPAAFFYLDPDRGSWPPQHPSNGGAWTWTDHNDNGVIEQNEITADPQIAVGTHTWAWQVDSNGDIWAAPEGHKTGDNNTIYRLHIDHFDTHGVPVYPNWGKAMQYSLPAAQLDRIERIYYSPANDEMLLTGYTAADRRHASAPCKVTAQLPRGCDADWGFLGTRMLRYQGWDAAFRLHHTPQPAASIDLPYRIPFARTFDFPKSMDVANSRVFVAYLASSRIVIYDGEHFTALGSMQPQPKFQSSWIDLPYGIRAIERGSSFYVLAEENLHGRNLVYKFGAR